MSVLVDAPDHPAHGRWWAHLASDRSLEELHAFAADLGLPRRSFEGDHYDVPAELVGRAVARGAEPVTTRELLRRLCAAGLRTSKRRGEKVVGTGTGTGSLAGVRVDVVRAARVPAPHGSRHLLVVTGDVTGDVSAGRVLLDGGRLPLAAPGGTEHAPVRTALGFRRTWWREDGRTRAPHDGVWLPAPGEVPAAGAQERAAVPLDDPAVTTAWWWPLAREHLQR
ncbi:DUF4031 domain-containing protein [Kineococcus auxinigenes]|uniref:DUF4031 domain-containing protein n=1 Tax=Kineococcus sp. SYSU DK033 TaxID=3383154 RepID=UPI003D7CF77A